jgi:hypothetical protein
MKAILNQEAQIRVDGTEGSHEELVELSTESLQLVGGAMHIAASAGYVIHFNPTRTF